MEYNSSLSQGEISFNDIQIDASELNEIFKRSELGTEWQKYQQMLTKPENNSKW